MLVTIGLALLSALIYDIYPPLAKFVIHDCLPAILAAFLYLGTGIGLGPFVWQFTHKKMNETSTPFQKKDWQTFAALIIFKIAAVS